MGRKPASRRRWETMEMATRMNAAYYLCRSKKKDYPVKLLTIVVDKYCSDDKIDIIHRHINKNQPSTHTFQQLILAY